MAILARWLSGFAALALSGLVLAEEASAQTRIVALGASNTYGKTVARGQDYPAVLQQLLRQRGVQATVINAGINGDTTGGMLGRVDRVVPAGTALVILQPGGNDRRKGQADRTGEIRARLAQRGVKVVMMPNSMFAAVPQAERHPDRQHFTPRGYAILAGNILPQVLAALGR